MQRKIKEDIKSSSAESTLVSRKRSRRRRARASPRRSRAIAMQSRDKMPSSPKEPDSDAASRSSSWSGETSSISKDELSENCGISLDDLTFHLLANRTFRLNPGRSTTFPLIVEPDIDKSDLRKLIKKVVEGGKSYWRINGYVQNSHLNVNPISPNGLRVVSEPLNEKTLFHGSTTAEFYLEYKGDVYKSEELITLTRSKTTKQRDGESGGKYIKVSKVVPQPDKISMLLQNDASDTPEVDLSTENGSNETISKVESELHSPEKSINPVIPVPASPKLFNEPENEPFTIVMIENNEMDYGTDYESPPSPATQLDRFFFPLMDTNVDNNVMLEEPVTSTLLQHSLLIEKQLPYSVLPLEQFNFFGNQ